MGDILNINPCPICHCPLEGHYGWCPRSSYFKHRLQFSGMNTEQDKNMNVLFGGSDKNDYMESKYTLLYNEYSDLKKLLAEKQKEIEQLNKTIQSLEEQISLYEKSGRV